MDTQVGQHHHSWGNWPHHSQTTAHGAGHCPHGYIQKMVDTQVGQHPHSWGNWPHHSQTTACGAGHCPCGLIQKMMGAQEGQQCCNWRSCSSLAHLPWNRIDCCLSSFFISRAPTQGWDLCRLFLCRICVLVLVQVTLKVSSFNFFLSNILKEKLATALL